MPFTKKTANVNVDETVDLTSYATKTYVDEQISAISEDLNIETYRIVDVEYENGYRDASNGKFTANSSFLTIYIDCAPGEKYSCSTNVSTSSLSIVNFYVNGVLYDRIGRGQIGIYTDYEFVVPAEVTQLSITSKSSNPPVLKKKSPIDISEMCSDIDILNSSNKIQECCFRGEKSFNYIFKYDNTTDVQMRIYSHGVNSLPQLGTFLQRSNEDDSVKLSSDGFSSEFCKIITDTISPYKNLNAINNIDGDLLDTNFWVGGYHGYEGLTSSTTAVAKNIGFEVIVDNKKIDSSTTRVIPISKNAKVIVTNQIQGCNTMKSDGSGRYILEEKITYTFFDIGKIEVQVDIKALEKLNISYYYGLMNTLRTYNSYILFENDNVNVTPYLNLDSNLQSGNKEVSDCYSVLLKNGDHCMLTVLDCDYGLGRMRYNDNRSLCNITTAQKLYFNLITTDFSMEPEQIVSWKGYYKFYKE